MDDIEYPLEAVKATRVPAEDIDNTFRSSCIGESANTLIHYSSVRLNTHSPTHFATLTRQPE
jgi:hypothetical protein